MFTCLQEFQYAEISNEQGVTIPSQRRYIEYYADHCLNKRTYGSVRLKLVSVLIGMKELSNDYPNRECFRIIVAAFQSKRECQIGSFQ